MQKGQMQKEVKSRLSSPAMSPFEISKISKIMGEIDVRESSGHPKNTRRILRFVVEDDIEKMRALRV